MSPYIHYIKKPAWLKPNTGSDMRSFQTWHHDAVPYPFMALLPALWRDPFGRARPPVIFTLRIFDRCSPTIIISHNNILMRHNHFCFQPKRIITKRGQIIDISALI